MKLSVSCQTLVGENVVQQRSKETKRKYSHRSAAIFAPNWPLNRSAQRTRKYVINKRHHTCIVAAILFFGHRYISHKDFGFIYTACMNTYYLILNSREKKTSL